MPDPFDAYFEWLGIPPEEQPPNHYRLLGVPLFVEQPKVIENAADQRMVHLKSFHAGKHGALSQKLLNEVAAARVCLLNPQKKAAYDAKLREGLGAKDDKSESSQELDAGLVEALAAARRPKGAPKAASGKVPSRMLIVGGVAGGSVLLLVVLWALVSSGTSKPTAQVAATGDPAAAKQKQSGSGEPRTPKQPQSSVVTQQPPESMPTSEAASPASQPLAEEKSAEAVKPVAEAVAPVTPKEVPASGPAMELPKATVPEPPQDQPKSVAPVSPEKPVATSTAPPAQQQPPPQAETPPPQATPRRRVPVPEGADLAQARKVADALFKAEFENVKTAADKVALAKRLLSQAVGQAGPADQYMLMLMAQDLAATARDAETAFQCVDQIDEAFEVNRFRLKTGILASWAKDARTTDARKWVVEQVLAIADEALEAANLDAARELGALAASRSSGLRDKDLAQKMKTYRQRFTEAGKDSDELGAAKANLAKDSQDPQANLVVGRYLCFTKNEWKRGLPLLALGSDEKLKRLADQELTSAPTEPLEQVALGDAWWEIAQTRQRSQMTSIKMHAGLWYRRSSPLLPLGLVRSNAEKRLAELEKLRSQLPAPPLPIAPFDEKQATQHQQRWATYLGESVETTNSIGMKLVLLPPGEFEMGSTPEEIAWVQAQARKFQAEWVFERLPREAPRHRVRISRPFYLGVHEVTQAEYEQVMGGNPSGFSAKGREAPRVAGKDTSRYAVEMVSWEDAALFCQKLSALPKERAHRRVYRLPTEAEWEYACRAGSNTKWSFGDDPAAHSAHAWSGDNSEGMTHPVGQKKPNAWGVHDMVGNVWEWCMDLFAHDYYRQSPPVDPIGPSAGGDRVLRGGSWGEPHWTGCRAAWRDAGQPTRRDPYIGFRVVVVR